MSKHRQAAKVDSNQSGLVKSLRKIPGVTVYLDVDDILLGYKGVNYWYEIKDPDKAFNKDMTFKKGAIKDSQIKLLAEWKQWNLINWTMLHPTDENSLEWLFFHVLDTGSTYDETAITRILRPTFISHHAEKHIQDEIVNIAMYIKKYYPEFKKRGKK